MAKEIFLTLGKTAIVDDKDYEWVIRWHWGVRIAPRTCYARRQERRGGRGAKLITYHLHRELMAHIMGRPLSNGEQIDHINGCGLDNRRCNLRICVQTENIRNQRKRTTPTSSRFKGITWNTFWCKWQAAIKKNGHRHHLGRFDSEEMAAKVYDAAAIQLHGEFAHLNFPTSDKIPGQKMCEPLTCNPAVPPSSGTGPPQ